MVNNINIQDIIDLNYDESVERIICSAVWFKDFIISKEIPNNLLLPFNCDKGVVFSGYRHHQCIYQAVAITGKTQYELGKSIQGFLTNLNRFVDREEGAKIALDNKQINKLNYSNNKLYSEDIY